MKYAKIAVVTRYVAIAAAFALFLVQGIALCEGLKATPDHFDFGILKEGVSAKVTVEIENMSAVPVEITNVRTS